MATFSSKEILEAMQIIADASNSKLKYDKTVQMQITAISDIEKGEYRAYYKGNTMTVYSLDLDTLYAIGDQVYVKIPEGDFSNTKIIEGKVSSSSSEEQTTLSNTIIEIEPSMNGSQAYNIPNNTWGFCSGYVHPDLRNNSSVTDWSTTNESITLWSNSGNAAADTLFSSYCSLYNKLMIKASFKTNFFGEHSEGTYGLILNIRTLNNDGEEEVTALTLDTSSFVGNPYGYTAYSPQYVIADLSNLSVTGIDSIELFQLKMEPDVAVNADGKVIYSQTKELNVFVQDIEIKFVEVVDLTQNKYYMSLTAPQGIYFMSNINTLTLTGKLLYGGQNVLSSDNCTYYWYKEDYAVVSGSDDYDRLAGAGWIKIADNSTTEIVDGNTLTIKKAAFTVDQKYKLIVVYGSNNSKFESEMTLYRYGATNLYLQQYIDSADIKLKINNSNYKGEWYRQAQGTNTILISSTKSNEITINPYLGTSAVTFYCKIYNSSNQFVVNRYFVVESGGSDEDFSIEFIGDTLFAYDSNGDPYDFVGEDAINKSGTTLNKTYESTLKYQITWKEGKATAYTAEWFFMTEDNLIVQSTTQQSAFSNTMFKYLYVDLQGVLHYFPRQKFFSNYNQNTVGVRITLANGKNYYYYQPINFTKDGEAGTNGTSYVCKIQRVDSQYNPITDYPILYSTANKSYENIIYLYARIYYNGMALTATSSSNSGGTSRYIKKCEWTVSSNMTKTLLASSGDNEGQIISVAYSGTASPTLTTSNYDIPYVKLTVTIQDNSETVELTDYYPFAYLYGTNARTSKITKFQTPMLIQYTAYGDNPSYDTQNIEIEYNNVDITSKVTNSSSLAKVVSYTDENDNTKYRLSVNNSFLPNLIYPTETDSDGNYVVRFYCPYSIYSFSSGGYTLKLLVPYLMYQDLYSNKYVNSWDGTTIYTDAGVVMSTQMAAGTKNDANKFNGIMLGEVSNGSTTTSGLFGFHDGAATFGFLTESGIAFFGSNAEIRIEPSSATITGKAAGTSYYMTLDLAADNSTDYAIKIGSKSNETFKVNYQGVMTCTGATVQGTIKTDSLTATGGTIGGWTINSSSITRGSTTLGSNGKITCSNADITGTINATSGSFGSWTISRSSIYNGNWYLSSSGLSYIDSSSDISSFYLYTSNTGVCLSGVHDIYFSTYVDGGGIYNLNSIQLNGREIYDWSEITATAVFG